MRQLAEDLYLLRGFPPNAINVYLAGDVLIDAATKQAARRILRQLRGRSVTAHALTHVHPDHQGSSSRICTERRIPLWCPAGEVDTMQTAGAIEALMPPSAITTFESRFFTGPPHGVDRPLREGDEVAGFTVLDTPGHSPGHISYWRDRDRVLILGDVLFNMSMVTGLPGLHEPIKAFTFDEAQNRASARRIAALEPSLVCFGHGPPLRDPAKLRAFVDRL